MRTVTCFISASTFNNSFSFLPPTLVLVITMATMSCLLLITCKVVCDNREDPLLLRTLQDNDKLEKMLSSIPEPNKPTSVDQPCPSPHPTDRAYQPSTTITPTLSQSSLSSNYSMQTSQPAHQSAIYKETPQKPSSLALSQKDWFPTMVTVPEYST